MTTRPTLKRIWASGEDSEVKDPGTEKYTGGWEAEIPTYQVLNYLQNKSDKTLLSLGERGVFEWGSDITYEKNALAWNEIDGKIYVSLSTAPDKTLSPDKNPSQWEVSSIQISRTEFDALNEKITTHVNSLGGTNPHELGPHDVDTYSRAEIDSMVSEDSGANTAHIQDKDNPHETTADQAGGVLKTGGEYTGLVTMGGGELDLDSTGDGKVTSTTTGVGITVTGSGIGVNASGIACKVASGVFTPLDSAYLGITATAAAATKLATARTIAGHNFDGTANITITSGDVGAYTKSECDTKYQPKGSYTPAGEAYTKAQSDARYIEGIQFGAVSSHSVVDNQSLSSAGYALTGYYCDGSNDDLDTLYAKPLQEEVNGAWKTIAG